MHPRHAGGSTGRTAPQERRVWWVNGTACSWETLFAIRPSLCPTSCPCMSHQDKTAQMQYAKSAAAHDGWGKPHTHDIPMTPLASVDMVSKSCDRHDSSSGTVCPDTRRRVPVCQDGVTPKPSPGKVRYGEGTWHKSCSLHPSRVTCLRHIPRPQQGRSGHAQERSDAGCVWSIAQIGV